MALQRERRLDKTQPRDRRRPLQLRVPAEPASPLCLPLLGTIFLPVLRLLRGCVEAGE